MVCNNSIYLLCEEKGGSDANIIYPPKSAKEIAECFLSSPAFLD